MIRLNIKTFSDRVDYRSQCSLFWLVVSFIKKNYQAILAPDIATFAVQTKTELPATEETLLILAEDKVVKSERKETTITYDSVAIKANRRKYIQKELAVYNQLDLSHVESVLY